MRFRSILLFLCPVLFLCVPDADAQKRVFATVNPNAAAINESADIYDPATGALTPVTNAMHAARENHTSTRLGNGKVLIAGGYNNHYLESAEIFDWTTGTFTETGDLITPRSGATSVLLRGGTVLIAGGYNGEYLSSAETYNPATETFTFAVGTMTTSRQNATSVLLNTGKVLLVGGYNGAFLSSAELYDPSPRTFIPTIGYMTEARDGHTATALSDGRVLIAGGCNNAQSGSSVCDNFLNSAEIYNTDSEEFIISGYMNTPRMNHTATLLPNGKVLIAGGTDGVSPLNSAEIFDPETGEFTTVGNMTEPRRGATATLLSDGRVLIAGGYSDHYIASAEVFNPSTGQFTAVSSSMVAPRYQHSAALMGNGKVLLTGGQNTDLMVFDVNIQNISDDVSPNIVFSSDSKVGFVPYSGSGTVLAFSPETGEVLGRIVTGGKPASITPLLDGKTLAVVSVLDNKIFLIDMDSMSLTATYTFPGTFGFGSNLVLSPDGGTGYISSAATGEVIKFDISTGNETGRLAGLRIPGQITITKNGNTLMVVDIGATEVVFVDTASMTEKYKLTPLDDYASASFTIYNKAVLNSDETIGIIASQDADVSAFTNAFFVFNPATGELYDVDGDGELEEGEGIYQIGLRPAYTTLLETGTFWLVLCQDTFSVIPTWDPSSVENYSVVSGSRMSSANIVTVSAKYAFYTSSAADRIYQQDIGTGAVVGSYLVGDDPNVSVDQASSLGLTPDGRTLVVLNYGSNELNLLTDTTVIRQPKLVNQQEKFTGLSIVNVSNAPVDVEFTAINDGGIPLPTTGNDRINPATVTLGPNAQLAVDAGQLFNLDPDVNNSGRIVIESDRPDIVGFGMTGQVHSGFFDSYVSSMQGIPLYHDYRNTLRDFIIPEIPQASDATTELNFINPNFNSQEYELTHYSTDGTVMETKENQALNGSIRSTMGVNNIITSSQQGRVLVDGGFDLDTTINTSDLFSVPSLNFSQTPINPRVPRYGHSSILLPSEKVLLAGGKNGFTILKSAEIYDPIAQSYVPTAGTMNVERYRHTVTPLSNGRVLVVGGQNSLSINNTAEIYDPLSGTFTFTAGSMMSPRDAHTATRLANGKVLIAGGLDGTATTATAEIFDPDTSTFSSTGNMNAARAFHTAVLLPNGKVLITGGYNGVYLDSAELYDPATGSFTLLAPMTEPRSKHTATLLSDGSVLIAGGLNEFGSLNTAETFDYTTGLFSKTDGFMTWTRYSHTATLLMDDEDEDGPGDEDEGNNDRVLLAGGYGFNTGEEEDEDSEEDTDYVGALSSAEIYDPVTRQFTPTTGSMTQKRQEHTAILITRGTQGYLRVSAPMGQLFTEVYSNGGASTAIAGIDMDKYVGVTQVYSPQFVISSDYITWLNVINGNQEEDATITMTLHAPDGTVLAAREQVLPPNAQLKGNILDIFQQDPSLQNRTGWLEVTSSVDPVVGTVSFTNSENKFLMSYELFGDSMENFIFPLVSEDSTFQTGVALLNSGDQPANIQLELWGTSGSLDETRSLTLSPHSRLSQVLTELFPGMMPRRAGNVRIHSDQPLFGIGVMYDRNLRFFSYVPATAIPGQ